MIIGLVGPKGSGKSTVAQMLIDMGSWQEVSFATVLKDVISILTGVDRTLFDDVRAKEEYVLSRINSDGTPDVCKGISIRKMMQICGTTFKSLFGPGVFIHALRKRIQQSSSRNIVVSDVRFPEEADFITKDLGGILIRIKREPSDDTDQHMSEIRQKDIICSEVLHNSADLSLQDLESLVRDRFTNVCIECFTSLGLQNPRQLCGKTYCFNQL
jgi:ABC-type dipeptide/oligopeptide/nickel transport system ATPase component